MQGATVSPHAEHEADARCRLCAALLVGCLAAAGLFSAMPAPTLAMMAEPSPSDTSSAELKSKNSSKTDEQAIPPKVRRYAERLLRRYDANQDGRLEASEWSKMHGKPQTVDSDKDGTITLRELMDHIAQFGRHRRITLGTPSFEQDGLSPSDGNQAVSGLLSPDEQLGSDKAGKLPGTPAEDQPSKPLAAKSGQPNSTFYVPRSRLPTGLPDWFLRRDADGDGQLSLAEFAPKPTQADLDEFARYDLNGDGFITAKECMRAGSPRRPAPAKPSAPPSNQPADATAQKPPSPEAK